MEKLTPEQLTKNRNDFATWCKRMGARSLHIGTNQASLLITGVSSMFTNWFNANYGKPYFMNYGHSDMFCHSIHFPAEVQRMFPAFLAGISVAFRVDRMDGLRIYTGIIPEYVGYGVDWKGFYPIENGTFSFEALNILLK